MQLCLTCGGEHTYGLLEAGYVGYVVAEEVRSGVDLGGFEIPKLSVIAPN